MEVNTDVIHKTWVFVAALGAHFATAIAPARPGHPKDKANVEGAVKILRRYLRFRYRRTTFTSIVQINQALAERVQRINDRRHSRFGVSRRERFETREKLALKALPQYEFAAGEWKEAKLHPDCYLAVESNYYSAPHIHRHKKLRLKLTEKHIEIILDLERLAIHPRSFMVCWLSCLMRISSVACATPATPCCVTPLALTRLFPPRLIRRV